MFCTIKLSKSDPTPLYIQLANELADLIRCGQLPSQTKLPTIRTLSRKLQINRDTVVSAYKMLEKEGLIIAHMGSGTYVAPIIPAQIPTTPSSPISCSALSFDKNLVSLSVCQDLLSQMIQSEGWSCFSDPLFRNRLTLKQSIVDYLKSVGILTTPSQVRMVKDMNSFLLEMLKYSNKSCLCVEEYHDLTYTSLMQSLGFKTYEIPLHTEGMDLIALEKYLKTGTISYIWCSPYIQNPTGITYSLENKKAILDLCEKYDCYILEDGTLSDFAYTQNLDTFYELDYNHRVIYLYHFSKLFLPHLHYTFVALPTSWSKKLPDGLECTLNECFLQYYLESSYLANLRCQLINDCYTRYIMIQNQLQACHDSLSFVLNPDGLFFWVTPLKLSPSDALQLFINHQIILAPGEIFTHRHTSIYFRISISNLSPDSLDQLTHVLGLFSGQKCP
ncbi:MAG: PLP-dependent aminotransferase family protein [Cellulosilyticaceae bacterium]